MTSEEFMIWILKERENKLKFQSQLFHYIFHSFDKYLLSTIKSPSTVTGNEDTNMNIHSPVS